MNIHKAAILTLAAVFIASCSTYKKEPDFAQNLSSSSLSGPRNAYGDSWLPQSERYTQRFAWKMEHLATQINSRYGESGKPTVLMTTIVPVDDLYKATSLGRLFSEQLMTELTKKGFKMIEARKTDVYLIRDKEGEFSLSREAYWLSKEFKADAVLVGSYSVSGNHAMVNVRMVSSQDSRVMAASSVMMNLKGDRFLNDLVLNDMEERGAVSGDKVGEMRVRKRIMADVDPYAEVLESMVGDMAGEIAQTATGKLDAGSTLAVATFVDVDNFYRASTFGRYMTERLIAEFHSMGFKVLEIRNAQDIFVDVRIGELALSREMNQIMLNKKADAVVLGTYKQAGDNVTVNARLVEGGAQEILGVGQMIVDSSSRNKFVTAMLENEITTVMPTETVEGY